MDSEHHKIKAELSIRDSEEAEIEQIACESYFVDIHNILKREIKEEAKECKPFEEYGVSNEYLENIENGKIHDPHSSEFEVMLRNGVEDPTESKYSASHFWENGNFNGLAGELTKSKVTHFNNGVMLKNEDRSECNDDSLTNNAGLKMETIKIKNDIDIVYDDVKPVICEEKSSGKSEIQTDVLIGTEIGSNFSNELSKETRPQQNIEEDGTAMERDNDTRKKPTVTTNSKNCQMIQKLPHSFQSKQESNARLDTDKKPFQCKICSKTFKAKGHLTRHEIIHSDVKPFQCKDCSKRFTQQKSLLDHARIHTGEKPFHCKVCFKSFKRKGAVSNHMMVHTGKKPFQCKICLKFFYDKGNLTRHERVHTGEKPFHCNFCQNSFSLKVTLVRHERTHTGEKPFQCSICPQLFIQKGDLTMHERIHTGERPFHCEVCLKSFRRKGNVTKHMKVHTGKKTFQCKICLKSFCEKGNLTRHEKVHTGEKPFQCNFCPNSFSLKVSLVRHERTHTGEKPC